MKKLRLAVLGLLILSILSGCYYFRNDRVNVSVKNKTNLIMQRISVISGGDKSGSGYLKVNKYFSLNIYPGENALPQLNLFYYLNGKPKIWLGPEYPSGKGFNMEIVVHDNDKLKYRSCLRPCSLSDASWNNATVKDNVTMRQLEKNEIISDIQM